MLTICLMVVLFPIHPESGNDYRCEALPCSGVFTDDPALCEGWPVTLNTPGGGFPYTPTVFDINEDGAEEVFFTGGHTFGLFGDGTFLPGWPSAKWPTWVTEPMIRCPGLLRRHDGRGCSGSSWSERDWYAGMHICELQRESHEWRKTGSFHACADDFPTRSRLVRLGDADATRPGGLERSYTGNTGDYYRI